MKKIIAVFLLLIGAAFVTRSNLLADEQAPLPRERLLFDFGWRFQLGDPAEAGAMFEYPEVKDLAKTQLAEIGLADKLTAHLPDPVKVNLGGNVSYVQRDFDDSAWRKLDLPHDWAVELPFNPEADLKHGFKDLDPAKGTTIGWYRREFELPASDQGRSLWIEFDGVFRNSLVWLNGKCLGRHVSGYTSFRYDISKVANFGGKNTLVVRADASRFEGWFYEGAGIYRHVWLVKTSPIHVAHWGTYVKTEMRDNRAEVTIETTLRNDSARDAECALTSTLTDERGQPCVNLQTDGSITAMGSMDVVQIKAGSTLVVTQKVEVLEPRLWSVESPQLYHLVSTVQQDRQVLDHYQTPFGIRTVHFDADKGFFLNGQPVKILGTCNHQNHAGVGAAMPDSLQYFRIKKLKEMGSNAYRTSHYPPTPELLEACDRLGMLVMVENRRMDVDAETLRQLESMVLRDRNHPSVFIWALGNEEFVLQDTNEVAQAAAVRIARVMQDVVHKLDPTRLCTIAMNNGWGDGFSTVVDVQGFNYRTARLDPWRARFPTNLSIATETASTRTTRGIYEDDRVRGYVAAYGENGVERPWIWWRYFARNPFMSGGFVWTGFDYRGEPTPYKWPCISSHFGLMDTCGFPKDIYYYYQSWWLDEPVLHFAPHWNWPGKEGEKILVRCFSNLDEIEIFVNGASIGKKPMERNGYLDFEALYAPGSLSAVGYRGGHPVAVRTVETTGAPAAIELQPDRAVIRADKEDVSVVTVSIVDARGRIVPVADNEIQFSATGGKIIGVGNGDPSSHEPDRATRRKVFNGLAQVILQSTDQAGVIELTATSPGLHPSVTKVTAKPARLRPAVK